MVANHPKDAIGMIEDIVQEKNATADVKDVTSMLLLACLNAKLILRIGLSAIALMFCVFL